MENRQTENKAYVVGILKEKNIEFKPAKSSGRMMAFGYLTVVIKNEDNIGEVRVKVQQFADKKDGTPNTLFKGLQTVTSTYKSIAEVGEMEADVIKIEGSIEDGTYYSIHKDDFITKLEIKGTFINRLKEKNTPHCCKVGFEGYLSKITPVENELKVEIVGVGYGGVAVVVDGIIPQELVAPFHGRYSVGCTTTLNFEIKNEVQIESVQSEVGFGMGLGETIERHITKRIVFGGSNPLFAGTPNSLSDEDVRKALALREENLEKRKADTLAKQGGSSSFNSGFAGAVPPSGSGFNMPQGVGFGGVSFNK